MPRRGDLVDYAKTAVDSSRETSRTPGRAPKAPRQRSPETSLQGVLQNLGHPFGSFALPSYRFFFSGLTLTLSRLLPPLVCVSAEREKRDRRLSPLRGHGMSRLLHPARAQRVGEASQPGPPSSSTTSTTSSDSDEEPPPTPACYLWMPKSGSWKWSTSRFTHQGKGPPSTILRQWAELHPDGQREIDSVLALHPDPPVGPPGSPDRPLSPLRFPSALRPPPEIFPPRASLSDADPPSFWLGQAVLHTAHPSEVLPHCAHGSGLCSTILTLHDPALICHTQTCLAGSCAVTHSTMALARARSKTGGQHLPCQCPDLNSSKKALSQAFLWPMIGASLLHTLSEDTDPARSTPDCTSQPGRAHCRRSCTRLLRAAKQGRLDHSVATTLLLQSSSRQ